jgi:hypothetical protein
MVPLIELTEEELKQRKISDKIKLQKFIEDHGAKSVQLPTPESYDKKTKRGVDCLRSPVNCQVSQQLI